MTADLDFSGVYAANRQALLSMAVDLSELDFFADDALLHSRWLLAVMPTEALRGLVIGCARALFAAM